MRLRWLSIAILSPLVLGACVFGGGGDRPAPKKSTAASRPRVSAPKPIKRPPTAEERQCLADLDQYGTSYKALQGQHYGSGCVVVGAVQLLDIGVPVTGLQAMRCPLARNFSSWVRFAVAPAARQILGSDVIRIESYGTFNCRPIAGSGRLSEHGLANAVDIAGFALADGRRITVLNNWNGTPEEQRFLRVVFQSACRRFKTALGPEYNRAHANHFHLDMGGKPFCR